MVTASSCVPEIDADESATYWPISCLENGFNIIVATVIKSQRAQSSDQTVSEEKKKESHKSPTDCM